jgi:hypothetical protein
LLVAHEPRSLGRALDELVKAFGCEAVALHTLGAGGNLEPWCARGRWRGTPGDLRACLTVPLTRGEDRVGALALRLPFGPELDARQASLIRTAAGALAPRWAPASTRLRHEPGRDALTGLADGRGFHAACAPS